MPNEMLHRRHGDDYTMIIVGRYDDAQRIVGMLLEIDGQTPRSTQ